MSFNPPDTQRTSLKTDTYLLSWVEAFLKDRKAQNVSTGTLTFYRRKLKLFTDYCETQIITDITQLTPTILRDYLLYLDQTNHNAGGVHACYRTVKAFLRWYEEEAEPDEWKNPIRKVKPPKVPVEPLDPVELVNVEKMEGVCPTGTFTGDRDKAILSCLLDTGCRADEFLQINISDVNLILGEILIRQGKGRKPRMVYLGKKSRKSLRAYLRHRDDSLDALWIRHDKLGRLKYSGLRYVIKRRAEDAGIPSPALHDFRRAFALSSWRNGMDLFTIASLMGHTSLAVLRRYLKITDSDLRGKFKSTADGE